MILDREIRLKLRSFGKATVERDGENIPAAVVYLETLLDQLPVDTTRADVLQDIASIYFNFDMTEHVLSTLRSMATLPIEDVYQLGSLAYTLSFYEEGFQEAKQIILKTVEMAEEKGQWLSASLGKQARVARNIGDQKLFAEALTALIRYKTSEDALAVPFEEDFLIDLPEGFCEEEIVKQYLDCKTIQPQTSFTHWNNSELVIRYVSQGETRCERNGIPEAGGIATINSISYYFRIYGVMHPEANNIRWFLSVPANLKEACSTREYRSFLETIRKELEYHHRHCSDSASLTLEQ